MTEKCQRLLFYINIFIEKINSHKLWEFTLKRQTAFVFGVLIGYLLRSAKFSLLAL